jgi:hypothetical protein
MFGLVVKRAGFEKPNQGYINPVGFNNIDDANLKLYFTLAPPCCGLKKKGTRIVGGSETEVSILTVIFKLRTNSSSN